MGRSSLAVALVLMTFIGVTLFATVAARILERAEAELAEARFGFVLARVDGAIEQNLALGFPIDRLPRADEALQEAMVRAPAILAADVVSPEGGTLYSTDRAALGEPIPAIWQSAIDDMRGDVFRANTPGSVSLGRAVENDFGLARAYTVVIVDRDALPEPLTRARTLVPAALPVALIAALAGGGVGAILLVIAARRRFHDLAPGNAARPADHANRRALDATKAADARLDEAMSRMNALDAAV